MMMYPNEEIIIFGDKFSKCKDCWESEFVDTWKFYILALNDVGRKTEMESLLSKFIQIYGINNVHSYLPFAKLALTYSFSSDLIKKFAYIMEVINKDSYKEQIHKILINKTIAVVGNCISNLENKNGKEIDSHDIVIRFNNYQIEGFQDYVGTKTNIWAYNGSDVKDLSDINQYDFIFISSNVMFKMIDQNIENIYNLLQRVPNKIVFYPVSYLNELLRHINHWTTTGTYLLYSLIKEGFIPNRYGFQDPNKEYVANYFLPQTGKRSSWHHMGKEYNFISKIIENYNHNT